MVREPGRRPRRRGRRVVGVPADPLAGRARPRPVKLRPGRERARCTQPPYTTEAVLSDGGVYDNLGLETAWKRYTTILVSDGGGKMGPAAEAEARLGAPRLPHARA